MKRFLFFIIFVVYTGKAFSQSVITAANHLPALGDWYQVSTLMELDNVSPGSAGENRVWDFSNLPQSTLDPTVATFIDPAGTPHIDEVPGCNLAISSGNDVYQYLKTSESGYEWSTVFINGNFALYTDPFTIFEFPFTYNSEFSDTYDYTIVAGELTTRFYGTQVTTSDAYGTIITPIGTFENVLRVVRETENHSVSSVSGYTWSYIDTTFEYQWYAPGITYPLVSLTNWTSSPDTFDVIYVSSYGLATNAEKLSEIEKILLYPNPVQDKLLMVSDESWDKASMFDLTGRAVAEWTNNSIGSKQATFNLEGFKNGTYILHIEHLSGRKDVRKITIQ